jgi:hypothetical protein
MTRGLFLAAVAGLCLATSSVAAQPSDPPRIPTASLSADNKSAAATGNSTHTVSQRLRTTILTNGAGRTLIVLGRGDGKR